MGVRGMFDACARWYVVRRAAAAVAGAAVVAVVAVVAAAVAELLMLQKYQSVAMETAGQTGESLHRPHLLRADCLAPW